MGKPIRTLGTGAIRAAVWRVDSRTRFYTVSIAKSYTDTDGNWHDRANFTKRELGKAIYLLSTARQVIEDLEARDRAAKTLEDVNARG